MQKGNRNSIAFFIQNNISVMLNHSFKESLWHQFGASIDMLSNTIEKCPEQLWEKNLFWYWAFHCLFYLDYYTCTDPDSFAPPAPFTLSEFQANTMPDRVYDKKTLLGYLEYNKEKARLLISSLNEENIQSRWINAYRNYDRFEIILYNMRHVQHHGAQLNLMLRQGMNDAAPWISRTKAAL
jgi:hypothetical protein